MHGASGEGSAAAASARSPLPSLSLCRAQEVMGNCPSTLRLLDRIDLVCNDEMPSPITSNGRKQSERNDSIPENDARMIHQFEVKDTTICLSEDSALLHRGQSLGHCRSPGQQQTKSPVIENLQLDENQSEQPQCFLLVQQKPSVNAIFETSDSQSPKQVPEKYLQLSSSGQSTAASALPQKTDQAKCPAARHQGQTLTPRLAVHKHTPINTSTGSSTSGVEISSSSSRSDLPQYPCRKNVQIIESSYDAEDLSSPDDPDNPLYVYRTPSFKKAIERGSAPDYDDLYAVGRSSRSDLLEPLPYYPVQHELQLAPSGFFSKLSVSTKVPHLLPPPYPFNVSPESSLKRGKSPASSIHEESSKQSSLRSFATPEAELDAVVKSGMDIKRETTTELVNQNSASLEHGSSPSSRWRCLSTLAEEELTEGQGSSTAKPPPLSRLPANLQPSASPSNVRKATAVPPLSAASSEKTRLSTQVQSPCFASDGADRRSVVLATEELTSDHNIFSRRRNCTEHILPSSSSSTVITSFPIEDRNRSPTSFLSGMCRTASDKLEDIHTDLKPKATKAEPALDKVSTLGKSRRKSLQEMRYICNNAEMPGDEASENAKSPDDDQSTFGSELYLTADPSEDSLSEAALSPKESIFPSLSDAMLAQLGLRSDGSNATKSLPDDVSLQETEEKFSSLALAFQTDKLTLDRRKELHLRARDVAEENIHRELEGLKDGMKALNQICNNSSSQQIFSKVQRHIEVLENAIARMSSRAEVHGAVQQELRVNQAIDVMVKHVENLKKVYEKEHTELLEARKTLRATRQDSRDLGGNDTGMSRTSNQPGLPQFRANRRRASIAVISKNPLQLRNNLPSFKTPDNPSRLVHRNSSFIIPPLCFEEENEESESTDIPRPLARRKSSSIIEDLPSDFLSRLQAASSRSRVECQKDMEEEKEEEPDENSSKDPVLRDFENESLETELSSDARDSSSCSQTSVPLKRMLSRKQSLRLMMIPSKLQKLKEKIHPILKYFPRVRFQDTAHQFLAISMITISACLILSFWLGWFHLVFGRLFSSGK